jgi:hypothetical protein
MILKPGDVTELQFGCGAVMGHHGTLMHCYASRRAFQLHTETIKYTFLLADWLLAVVSGTPPAVATTSAAAAVPAAPTSMQPIGTVMKATLRASLERSLPTGVRRQLFDVDGSLWQASLLKAAMLAHQLPLIGGNPVLDQASQDITVGVLRVITLECHHRHAIQRDTHQ